MKAFLVIFAMLLLATGAAFAEVSDFECLPHAPGLYIQGYPSYFRPPKLTMPMAPARIWQIPLADLALPYAPLIAER
mgnify:CR=1 FL=1